MNEPESIRDKVRKVWSHPAGRVYASIASGALVTTCFPLVVQGQSFQALMILALGLCAIFFQMTFMPFMVLAVSAVLVSMPYGAFPVFSGTNISNGYLNVFNMMMVGSLLIYFMAQFRLYTLVSTGMPGPSRLIDRDRPKKQRTVMRSSGKPGDPELMRLFVTGLAFVAVGQAVWFLVTSFRVGIDDVPTLKYMPSGRLIFDASYIPEWGSRVTLAFGSVVAGTIVIRYALWYWWRCTMNREEGGLALTDTGWLENRRELSRMETWRAWALNLRKTRERRSGLMGLGCILILVVVVPLILVTLLIAFGVLMFIAKSRSGGF